MMIPAPKRKPPAYLEYASDMLGERNFQILSLQQKGLLYAMKLELWLNYTLPTNLQNLAKILHEAEDEVAQNLPAIMPFFAIVDNEIISPELEMYRSKLNAKRNLQSAAGKKTQELLEQKKYPVDGVIKLNLRK